MFSIKGRSALSILLHVLTWILFAFILLFYQPLSWSIEVPFQFWIKQVCILVILVGVFYINSTILVPRLLLKNKNIAYIIVLIAIISLVGPFVKWIDEALQLPDLMEKAFFKNGFPGPPKRGGRLDMFLIMMISLIIGISTSITLIQTWQGDQQNREALEKDKIGSELSFLKAQINPHFFFNTLNNIYALTHIDVEKSRNALHKLSRMMRYLLYDTQSGSTPLSKEIDFIVDYLDLMKIRLNDLTTVEFEAPTLTQDFSIAPMLFLPYIENAFKHGVSTLKPSVIKIALEIQGDDLHLNVRNSIFNQDGVTADEYGGIGLSNTKRRLDILYPGRHSFSAQTQPDTNEYIVDLTINLNDTKLHSSRR